MNRRVFMHSTAGWAFLAKARCALGTTALNFAGESEPQQDTATQNTMEEWMDRWMHARTRGEEGTLFLSRFVEPVYFLTKPIKWKPNLDQPGYKPVTVPVGFVTDLASIPRPFWSMLRPDGEYVYPAIVHDYLYWMQDRPRETADRILKLGMQDFGVERGTVAVIYRAVRAGGGSSWNQNRELKRAGERRILKIFPDDPRTRWIKYKQNPAVFADS